MSRKYKNGENEGLCESCIRHDDIYTSSPACDDPECSRYMCDYCQKWRATGRPCTLASHGECDCPKCQGMCECDDWAPWFGATPLDEPCPDCGGTDYCETCHGPTEDDMSDAKAADCPACNAGFPVKFVRFHPFNGGYVLVNAEPPPVPKKEIVDERAI